MQRRGKNVNVAVNTKLTIVENMSKTFRQTLVYPIRRRYMFETKLRKSFGRKPISLRAAKAEEKPKNGVTLQRTILQSDKINL